MCRRRGAIQLGIDSLKVTRADAVAVGGTVAVVLVTVEVANVAVWDCPLK